jgi:hypothetical protein
MRRPTPRNLHHNPPILCFTVNADVVLSPMSPTAFLSRRDQWSNSSVTPKKKVTIPEISFSAVKGTQRFKQLKYWNWEFESHSAYWWLSAFFCCGSSGSIVSDYGLDDREIEVRSPTEAEDFSSSPCVQTGSEAHPASYPMGTGGHFPGGKARPGRDADHSPPSSGPG